MTRDPRSLCVRSWLASVALFSAALLAPPSSAEAQCAGAVPNGIHDRTLGEDCDDGNLTAGDGCTLTCDVEPGYQCRLPIDFSALVAENYPGAAANWSIAANGRSGTQLNNTGHGTIARFGADASATTYLLDIRVTTASDDDFIGFVLGYQPGDVSDPAADFLLVDWKQIDQASGGFPGPRGLALSRVNGIPTTTDLWTHRGAVTELARGATRGSTGWVDFVTYRFEITYSATHLRIRVNGTTELDIAAPTGGWPQGEIGFYGLSQENVYYELVGPLASVCTPICGDNDVIGSETCDDGGTAAGDGCSATCAVEPGYACTGEPSMCEAICGDALVRGDETCDDDGTVSGDGCSASCRREVAITSPPPGSPTADTTPTISGTANPGASVEVTVGGVTGTVTANAAGVWSFTPSTPLPDGTHAIAAVATDDLGDVSMASSSVIVDSTTTVAITAPTGVIADSTPTISGTGEPGASVTVVLDGTTVGTVIVSAGGTWSIPASASLAPGPHSVTANATDTLGNTATDTGSFTVVACLTAAECGGSTPFCSAANVCVACLTAAHCGDGDACTSDVCTAGACSNPPTSSGSTCAGGVCDGSGDCVECVADAQCSGAEPRCDVASNTCVACLSASDCGDSNACTSDVCTAGVCSHPPTSSGSTCGASGVCDGSGACVECVTDAQCSGATPRCDASTSTCVECLGAGDCDDDNECTADACGAGSCTHTPVAAGTTCATGVCDPTGACGAATVDITAPADGAVTAVTTPLVTGTASPGLVVTVTVDGVVVGTTTAAADGSWSLMLDTALADGSHTITASVSEGGGATDMVTITVDASTDVAITGPADGATTMDATPDIDGTGEPGAEVVVVVDGVEVGRATVEPDGTWRVMLSAPLPNGTHEVVATATDALGNTDTATSDFIVDADTDVAITAPENGDTIRDTAPVVTGTAVPGATIVVTLDGEEVGTVTADAEGNWSLPLDGPLADGEHVVTATATDPAGNMAEDTSTFTVDTVTTVSIDDVDADEGVIRGTGEPGATIEITIDGEVVGTVTVGEDGTWRFDGDPLDVGEHEIVARGTDAAGNEATDTTSATVEPEPDGGSPDAGARDGGVSDVDGGSSDRPGLAGGGWCTVGHGSDAGGGMFALIALVGLALRLRRRGAR